MAAYSAHFVLSLAEIVETGEQVSLSRYADASAAVRDMSSRLGRMKIRDLLAVAGDFTLRACVVEITEDAGRRCRTIWSWRWRISYERDPIDLDAPATRAVVRYCVPQPPVSTVSTRFVEGLDVSGIRAFGLAPPPHIQTGCS